MRGVRSRPYVSSDIYVYSSCWGSPVGVSLILSPINSIPMSMKSKSNIEKTSSPSSLCSSTHYCTSSSKEESSKGSTWVDGKVPVALFVLCNSMALASWVLPYRGSCSSSSFDFVSSSSSSPLGMVLERDGLGTNLLLTLCLFFIWILILFLCFFGIEGEVGSSCVGGMEACGISPSFGWLDMIGGNYGSS